MLDYLLYLMRIDRVLTGAHPANRPCVLLIEKLGLRQIAPEACPIS